MIRCGTLRSPCKIKPKYIFGGVIKLKKKKIWCRFVIGKYTDKLRPIECHVPSEIGYLLKNRGNSLLSDKVKEEDYLLFDILKDLFIRNSTRRVVNI